MVLFGNYCHVEEVNQGGGRDLCYIPGEDTNIVEVCNKHLPLCCEVTRSYPKDLINASFEVEEMLTVVWVDYVYLMLCKV